MLPNKFTIRVYGLLVHKANVLLSKEYIKGENYIKLPGGGLEFGEGVLDCLQREFKEELDLDVTVKGHFYTTEGYFPSAFDPSIQVVSLYYFVETDSIEKIPIKDEFETQSLKKFGDQIVYWCPINELDRQNLKLPIDKIVLEKLKRESSFN